MAWSRWTRRVSEYRINKKGCECFRTTDLQAAKEKLQQLNQKRPGIYTLQTRSCDSDRFGEMRYQNGQPAWSIWS